MRLSKLLITSLYIIFPLHITGQEVKISVHGHVSCREGSAVVNKEGVLVSISSKGAMLAYTYTDSNGRYELICPKQDSLQVSAYNFGYKKRSFYLYELPYIGNKYQMDCVLEEDIQYLEEVLVKPPNIEQDTINIKLEKYMLAENDKLNTILQKNPNFNVDEEGSITYKGKPIHRILVDGDEFFLHQNAIALDKIESRMIDGMQIINNYTDKFSVGNEWDEETVLNLKANKQLKSLLIGSLSGGYGLNNSLDGQLSLMRFAKRHRGFLTNNTNNVGRSTMSSKDLMNLFGDMRPISYIQAKILNALFITENRKKDFASTTNLSYITQGKRSRTQLLFYYLYRDRENSKVTVLSDRSSEINYKNTSDEKSKSNSFFITFKYDLSPHKSQALNYTFSSIITNPALDAGNTIIHKDRKNSTTYYNGVDSYSFYNKLQYHLKIRERWLWSTVLDSYHESSESQAKLYSIIPVAQVENLEKDYFGVDVYLSYQLHPYVIARIGATPYYSDERISDSYLEEKVRRRSFIGKYTVSVYGQKLWDKWSYKLSIGYTDFNLWTSPGDARYNTIPISGKLAYENRLNRFYVSYLRDKRIPLMNTSTTEIGNNQIFRGDPNCLTMAEDYSTFGVGYSYNSFITGKSFNLSSSYNTSKNGRQFVFVNLDDGIEYYDVFQLINKQEYQVDINGSFLLFNRSDFPVKTVLASSYKYGKGKTAYLNNSYRKITTQVVTGKVALQSISKRLINFETTIKYTYNTSTINQDNYINHYVESRYALVLNHKKIEGELAYIFNSDWVLQHKYTRNNIDANLTYKLNSKLHFSLEGQNIDQFFPLFDNRSYAIRTRVLDGISQTIFYTQSIRYLLFKIKINF